MNVRIGARKVQEKLINTYVIHCRNMSGDSNHYDITATYIEDSKTNGDTISKKIRDIIELYSITWFMNNNDRNEKRLVVKKIIEKGDKLGIEDPVDLYADLVGYDVTSEDVFAIPELLWVTFFNYLGNEFMVEIVNNDKVFMGGINEGNIGDILN